MEHGIDVAVFLDGCITCDNISDSSSPAWRSDVASIGSPSLLVVGTVLVTSICDSKFINGSAPGRLTSKFVVASGWGLETLGSGGILISPNCSTVALCSGMLTSVSCFISVTFCAPSSLDNTSCVVSFKGSQPSGSSAGVMMLTSPIGTSRFYSKTGFKMV